MSTAWDDALLGVPIESVAMVAASLLEASDSPAAATLKAYELLEYAAAGHSSLKTGKGFVGVTSWEAVKLADKQWRDADLGVDASVTDSKGKMSPVGLKEALASLMPRQKGVERLPRFRHWLMESYARVEAEAAVYTSTEEFFAAVEKAKQKRISIGEAGDLISRWSKLGVPPHVYAFARQEWPFWWKKNLGATRSHVGKQGRVRAAKHRVTDMHPKDKRTHPRTKLADKLRDMGESV